MAINNGVIITRTININRGSKQIRLHVYKMSMDRIPFSIGSVIVRGTERTFFIHRCDAINWQALREVLNLMDDYRYNDSYDNFTRFVAYITTKVPDDRSFQSKLFLKEDNTSVFADMLEEEEEL